MSVDTEHEGQQGTDIKRWRVLGSSTRFHLSQFCPRIVSSDSTVEAVSDRDVAWYELEPCPHCEHLRPDDDIRIKQGRRQFKIPAKHREALDDTVATREEGTLKTVVNDALLQFVDRIETGKIGELPRPSLTSGDDVAYVTVEINSETVEAIVRLINPEQYVTATSVLKAAIQHHCDRQPENTPQ
jgi:hypothetical protein